MFGIDLGISVSSITCITGDSKILDYAILFGDKQEENEWTRIVDMSEALVNSVITICKSHPGVFIAPLVSIEEPVYPYKTRNPRSYFNMSCLYALTRNRLFKRNFKIYSVNPLSVKTTAKVLAFKKKKLKKIYHTRGRLNKKGMIRAFVKLVGREPSYHTIVGRETLADSYFIAQTGLDRRRLKLE